jgi:hypothetical protein
MTWRNVAIRRRPAALAIVLLASYAYFYQGGGWNQNTRFDLVRAVTERHTLRIDLYHDNTGDKAEFGGHYYSDKAPGASFTAVPPVAAARVVLRFAGVDLYEPATITALSHVATLFAAGLPAALAALSVFWISRRFGTGDGAAGLAAVVCGLGTPLWAYATVLYGHALAAGCLALALFGVMRLGDGAGVSIARVGFWTGAAAGWAVVTEFPASIPAAMIVACAGWQMRAEPARLKRAMLALGIGLSVPAAVLLLHNWLAFGSLFHIGYSSETAGFEGMETGIFGVNWPKLDVLGELLLGTYRGLLPLAPVLVVAPFGFWILLRQRSARPAALVAAGVAAYYFLMTAGYVYWDGGWSYGSRHLGPALPFVVLGVAPVWQRTGRLGRVLLLVLACLSVGQSLVAVSTTAQPPGGRGAPADPMRELLWPAFASGEFPIGWQSVLERQAPSEAPAELRRRGIPRASWNLGQLVGLTGHASLVPLMLVWIGGLIAWRRGSAV